jgi:hypothetical protein
MERLLQTFREYPAIAGLTAFSLISVLLAFILGNMMLRSGASLKPLIFFFGFLAIVGVPQATIHVLDALAHRRAVVAQADAKESAGQVNIPASSDVRPVAWEVVFGPKADPALITDAKRGLEVILSEATEAKLSFNASGESALAARFAHSTAAAAALDRYGAFFQFSDVSGSDASGWTGKRYQGQGEWNHVVAAGSELYAWTGPTRESVVANRVRALGPFSDAAAPAQAISKRQVSTRLSSNLPVSLAFITINLLLAVGWFFKASAWSASVPPAISQAVDLETLRQTLLAMDQTNTPVSVTTGADGKSIEVTWRYADARWFDLMRLHQMKRLHKLALEFDSGAHKVRIREFWSAFDASAGAGGLRADWKASVGMMLFQVDHVRVGGVQLDPEGKPTGELSQTYSFDLQKLKAPFIQAVTDAGWRWQPVMWTAPKPLRWLTE